MIRKIGNTEILPVHRPSCHCGAVVLELDLPGGIGKPRRCNCSICRRKAVDPFEIANVPTSDGVHHSSDRRS